MKPFYLIILFRLLVLHGLTNNSWETQGTLLVLFGQVGQKVNAGARKNKLQGPELWGTTSTKAGSVWGVCTISPISNPGLLRVEQPRFLWGYEHFFSWVEVGVGSEEEEVGFVPHTVTWWCSRDYKRCSGLMHARQVPYSRHSPTGLKAMNIPSALIGVCDLGSRNGACELRLSLHHRQSQQHLLTSKKVGTHVHRGSGSPYSISK